VLVKKFCRLYLPSFSDYRFRICMVKAKVGRRERREREKIARRKGECEVSRQTSEA